MITYFLIPHVNIMVTTRQMNVFHYQSIIDEQ